MNNLVEYKATINSGQAKISNLNDELLEHEKELQNATAKIEELVCIKLYNSITTRVQNKEWKVHGQMTKHFNKCSAIYKSVWPFY